MSAESKEVAAVNELNSSERVVDAGSELVVDDAETVGKTESGDCEHFESHSLLYYVVMNCLKTE